MKWVVSSRKEIVQNKEELYNRSSYIKEVIGTVPIPWQVLNDDRGIPRFFISATTDKLNGIFITGHVGEIEELSQSKLVSDCEFVVANTCVWSQLNDKKILYGLMQKNPRVKLWFAKQDLSIENGYQLRKTNLLSNVGIFGFSTSKSERLLFLNRKKGFMNALGKSFDLVSPILLPKDYR